MTRAGAPRVAAELGLALVAPDTGPRRAKVNGEGWGLGVSGGFYLNASEPGWSHHHRMDSWIMQELLPLLAAEFPLDEKRIGIFGHSMGGHGALTLALRHRERFRTLSAFAPICAPADCPWGRKAFAACFGGDLVAWREHDATYLMERQKSPPYPGGILIDQALGDGHIDDQLMPIKLSAACEKIGQPIETRFHAGYDNGYYFISTFMEDHLRFHWRELVN